MIFGHFLGKKSAFLNIWYQKWILWLIPIPNSKYTFIYITVTVWKFNTALPARFPIFLDWHSFKGNQFPVLLHGNTNNGRRRKRKKKKRGKRRREEKDLVIQGRVSFGPTWFGPSWFWAELTRELSGKSQGNKVKNYARIITFKLFTIYSKSTLRPGVPAK